MLLAELYHLDDSALSGEGGEEEVIYKQISTQNTN